MRDINYWLKIGRNSKSKIKRHMIDWFIRHYFGADISCETNIADSCCFAHGGLGCVISKGVTIGERTFIQHRVTMGV